MTKSSRAWLAPAAVALVTAAVFLPVLANGWVDWDDTRNFAENFRFRGLGLGTLAWMFKGSFGLMGNYEPLHWLLMGVGYALWGLHPAGYHFVALALHAASAALVFLIARRLLTARLGEREGLGWAAAFAALLFGLHPLRVEAVAWISGQHHVEAGLFYLLSVWLYLKGDLTPSLACYAASLLFFPVGLTLPLGLLILDRWVLERWAPREKLPYFALAAAGGLLAALARRSAGMVLGLGELGPAQRLARAAWGLAFYPRKLLWPEGLIPYYRLPLDAPALSPSFVLSAAAVLGLTVLLWQNRGRRPALWAAWALYAVTILPVLGLTQTGLQAAADRYTYLSCLSFALLAAGGLWTFAERDLTGAFTVGVLVLGLCGVKTLRYERVWKDSESLWSYVFSVDPDIALGRVNLGNALARQGRMDEAMAQFRRALALEPGNAYAHNNLGRALRQLGRVEEALPEFREAVRLAPKSSDAHSNLGGTLLAAGRFEEGVAELEAALKLQPRNPTAHNNLGVAYSSRGLREQAIAHYRAAIEANAGYADPHANLGLALAEQGKKAEAVRELELAVRLDPSNASAIEALSKLSKP